MSSAWQPEMVQGPTSPIEWSPDELEPVAACPVCGSEERETLYCDLQDRLFFAQGIWTLKACSSCGSAYLDPRPTRLSIHKAYAHYYTHQETPASQRRDSYSSLSLFRKLRRQLADGYCNRRYGTQFEPASSIGWPIAYLVPRLRRQLDRRFRFLPRVGSGRLLDVGCGSGRFLVDAQQAGWRVAGVDPDPNVASASLPGVEFRHGGIDQFADQAGEFDVVTLSHVIEHEHWPLRLLREAWSLLKPGALLYVDTPNVESLGRCVYGANWRGLEYPRHLVIFSFRALRQALESSGYRVVRRIYRPEVALHTFPKSRWLRDKGGRPAQVRPTLLGRVAATVGLVCPNMQEYLTVIATKQET